ncbi:hypothetical protein BJY04DRAFT_102535 [Aspergillus karnatakaensis]|uniref:uncharacterized protein n=1 Tax=Aspergillus karnatakaensis TaxID=1810916 RepID=UPI003CCD844D
MHWLVRLLRSLYSLETLDTRFSRSSTESQLESSLKDPFKPSAPNPLSPGRRPSKWRTIEYYVYYLVIAIVVPTIVKQVLTREP